VRNWLPADLATPPSVLALALADAAGEVEHLRREQDGQSAQGRQTLWLRGHPLLIVWENTPRQMTALVRGPSWFAQVAPLWRSLNVTLVLLDAGAHPALGRPADLHGPVTVRPAADTGLPWTLRVSIADSARELASLSGQGSLALAGLALVGILVLAGGYLVERALARELAAARLQADFVATVSHEFRSPLTSMKHLLEMLEDGAVSSEDRRHRYYHVLAGETERLRQLVENLLSFRRLEAGKAAYHFEKTDARTLVEQVAGDFSSQLATRDRLITSVDGSGVRVNADREALSRALWNLLDNAAKYSPEEALIHLDLSLNAEQVAISVRDHGQGIPASEQKRIFEKFYRGAAAGTSGVKGTGIGLSTVNHIVRAHRGRIRVDSVPGQGSTFTIVLPGV
jgi:signal transduction histidine kinase